MATIAVRNLETARSFYEGKLGLKRGEEDEPGLLTFQTGRATLLVYESRYAGTNQATAATWAVDDVEAVVRTLAAKGVAFEHYDLPDTAREGDVHISGDTRVAWFKDPDGNILSVVNR
jgi:catechol 2,3-dioxygenase-like lactoylglutathione lyase family enzyme